MKHQEQIINQQVMRLIAEAEHPLFIAHKKPDGDTLGAVTAFINYALEEHKTFSAFCLDAPPATYRYLPGIEHVSVEPKKILAAPIDLIVVLDAGDLVYAGAAELVKALKVRGEVCLINLDHHVTNQHFGDYNLVPVDAASTTEVIVRLFQTAGYKISGRVATCLLTGILTDTGGLSNPATSATVINEAAELLSHGATFPAIMERLNKNKSLETLKLWGRVLGNLKYNRRFEIATVVIPYADWSACGGGEDVIDGLANFLNSLIGVKATLLIKELPARKIKGSFRTTRADMDVARWAEMLGGGGHKKAAGFMIDGELCQVDGCWQLKS